MTIPGILIVLGLLFFIYIAKVIFSVIDLTFYDNKNDDKDNIPWKTYTKDIQEKKKKR